MGFDSMVYWGQFLLRRKAMKKLENFWFYYKKPVLIALAALAVLGYLGIQKASAPKPDYHIGLVQSTPCTEEYLSQLEARFAAAGADVNGDGQILVKVHTYFVDLKVGSDNVGFSGSDPVAALDADLIGKVRGIFLLEDPDTFHAVTDGIAENVLLFENTLQLALRKDADDAYRVLADQIN